jgi:hypothetical protein
MIGDVLQDRAKAPVSTARYNATLPRKRIVALADRSKARRERMVVNRARDHGEAERWDLEFWQSRSPAERLAALAAIHQDIANVPGTGV